MKKRKIEKAPFVAPAGYMTRKDAMAFLRISNATIYNYELRGLLHPSRVGIYAIYPFRELEEVNNQKSKLTLRQR